MNERRFRDAEGVEWRVHVIVQAPKVGPLYPAHSAQFRPATAWLAFDSNLERRRLSPVPKGWEDVDAEQLQQLLRTATLITRRLKEGGDSAGR